MAKVVRFKTADQREWNQNQTMVVDQNGSILRQVTSKEHMTMFQVSKHVANTSKPFSTKTPDEESTVEARLTKLPGSSKSRIDFFIDGQLVRGGRELIKDRLLRKHGPCMVYGVNSKFLTMIRDPNAAKPKPVQGTATAPSPEACMCKNWNLSNGQPHPGRHHPVCQFNDKAPIEERGDFNDVGGGIVASDAAPTPAYVVPLPPVPQVPAPEACHCKGWNLPNGDKKPDNVHHPVCEFKEKWEASSSAAGEPGDRYYIVNLETFSPMREATPEEVAQAEEAEKTTGVMTINIDEMTYGVMLEADLKAAVA